MAVLILKCLDTNVEGGGGGFPTILYIGRSGHLVVDASSNKEVGEAQRHHRQDPQIYIYSEIIYTINMFSCDPCILVFLFSTEEI
jgi:hypothetical protein